jgi:hypothetical protein
MNISSNIIMAGLTSLMFTACDPSPDMADGDVRVKYLESNHPQLKNLRDQIVFQIKTGRVNIVHLEHVRDGFTQDASKKLVDDKIRNIKQQQSQLDAQLKRIDTEAERGIALKEFNVVDGGGERKAEIEALTQESSQRVTSAAKLNNNIDEMYNGAVTPDTAPLKHVRPTHVVWYEHYNELPPVNRDKLDQTFNEHPEMFDIEHQVGKTFIQLVRQLKVNNPQYFTNPYWIENAVRSVIY